MVHLEKNTFQDLLISELPEIHIRLYQIQKYHTKRIKQKFQTWKHCSSGSLVAKMILLISASEIPKCRPSAGSLWYMIHFHIWLSFEWNSIRLGGPAHGIVTKTVHKTLPGGGGGRGWGSRGWWGSGVVGVRGGGGLGGGGQGW